MLYNDDKLQFQILSVDKFTHFDGVLNVRPRPFAALSFRTEGSAAMDIGGCKLYSNIGDILFIPDNLAYKAEYHDSTCIVVHLTECSYKKAEAFTTNNNPYFKNIFNNMLQDWKNTHSVNSVKSDVFKILQGIYNQSKEKYEDDFIKAVSYIQNNFTNPDLKINEVCHSSNISEPTLYRRFLKYYNISPKQYLISLRLNYALELLLQNKFSIKEIALLSGFDDEKYFSRLIKNKLGNPPSAFYNK